jgi:hypothetical protein
VGIYVEYEPELAGNCGGVHLLSFGLRSFSGLFLSFFLFFGFLFASWPRGTLPEIERPAAASIGGGVEVEKGRGRVGKDAVWR